MFDVSSMCKITAHKRDFQQTNSISENRISHITAVWKSCLILFVYKYMYFSNPYKACHDLKLMENSFFYILEKEKQKQVYAYD